MYKHIIHLAFADKSEGSALRASVAFMMTMIGPRIGCIHDDDATQYALHDYALHTTRLANCFGEADTARCRSLAGAPL